MPVDFHFSPSEDGTRQAASTFAQHVLRPSREEYLKHAEHHHRFQATKPVYAQAVSGGLIKGQISPSLGGSGGSLVESAILVEECYSVERGAALTIFATGLGLTPLNLILPSKPELRPFLDPFLRTEDGSAPLASLVFSEPGGVANYIEPGAPGLLTTARREGDEYVINGEKIWATNCAGWDFKGADLACVVCRDVSKTYTAPKDAVMIILVTRQDLDRSEKEGKGKFEVVRHQPTAGHTAASGPHVRYTDIRVPVGNVLCQPGEGVDIVTKSFDASAVLVGAMSVGLMRAAFDAALAFAKGDHRRGAVPLLERQAVADLLSGVKMTTEASRMLTWKAAHVMEHGPGDYDARRELALQAKVYCSDAAVKAVMDVIHVVGVTAYDAVQPFGDMLKDAMVLPIFDGGNVGIRRRHLQQLMLSPTYDAWAATFGPSTPPP